MSRHNGPRKQTWATPQALVDLLEGLIGRPFDLDVCAEPHTAKVGRYYTVEDDGLTSPWGGLVWCNPPFEAIDPWVSRALIEILAGRVWGAVILVPGDRNGRPWWRELRRLERATQDTRADLGDIGIGVWRAELGRIAYSGQRSVPFSSTAWLIGPEQISNAMEAETARLPRELPGLERGATTTMAEQVRRAAQLSFPEGGE